jgi:long-chain fatty acid transport protein
MTRALLLAALLLPSVARANPIDAFGFGARGAAMGSAMSSVAEDGSANYYNPAGLVRGKDLRLDLGYRWAEPLLKLNGNDVKVDASHGLNIGIVAPGAIGPFRFAFGVGLWLPDNRLTRVRSLPIDQPRFQYYDNRMQRFLLAANLAVQIVRGLYLGAGFNFMSRTSGVVSLRGRIDVTDADSSSLTTKMEVDLLPVRYPQVGLRWDATKYLSFGVTYRHSFALEAEQAFNIKGAIGNEGQPPVVEKGYLEASTRATDLFQPWQLTVGGSAQFARTLIAVDLTYARWSEQPDPASEVDIMLDIGMFNSMVKLPPKRPKTSPGFHDIIIPRLGIEHRARDWQKVSVDARFGYVYEPTPIPRQDGESNLADSDKHTFSIGTGVELRGLGPILPKPLAIDLYFAATYLPERFTRKSSALDPTGDFRATGVVIHCGLDLRTRF